jgi:outer membrane usher protein
MKRRGQGVPGNGRNPRVKRLTATIRCGCLSLVMVGSGLALADNLPPPPTEMSAIADATLYLDLLVNQMPRAELVPVQQRAGQLYLDSEVLRAAGISLPGNPQGEVALEALVGLHTDYDSQNQRLLLQVPPAWLPDQQVGERSLYPPSDARSSFGALFNYDLYLNDTDESGTYLAAWNELRLFDSWGTLSSTGQWRQAFNGAQAEGTRRGFLRYDTTWRFTDEQRLLTYEAGDLATGALPWTSAVRVGGVQLSRDFAARPDLIIYPLPAFAGEAAVPTSLDLFINGYKSSSAELQPGPYTLTNVPFINGAGEAVVVTTDTLGRQVSTTLPFYVTSSLLQKGSRIIRWLPAACAAITACAISAMGQVLPRPACATGSATRSPSKPMPKPLNRWCLAAWVATCAWATSACSTPPWRKASSTVRRGIRSPSATSTAASVLALVTSACNVMATTPT